MRLNITVGELVTGDKLSLRRCEDKSIVLLVQNPTGSKSATYQKTLNGLFLLDGCTYSQTEIKEIYTALNAPETQKMIECRAIELQESRMRIDYVEVLTDGGHKVKIGQSNNMLIYIIIENVYCRAIFNYVKDTNSIKFVSSSYPQSDNETIAKILKRNLKVITEAMENTGMIESKKNNAKNRLYQEGFSSSMTESGKVERQKVDRTIEIIFKELDEEGYSNLEVQSMLLESVFEVALTNRLKHKKN